MKIPKRVNNALDWAEDNIRVIAIVTALVIVSATALWMPAIAAFVAGALVGGVTVRWRMVRRLNRLRADADDLLRENGALRHEKTVLSQGVIASSGQLTQKLPIIRSVEEPPRARPIEAPRPARPVQTLPVHDLPAQARPVHDRPVHDRPVHDLPERDRPGPEGPARGQDAPSREQPVDDQADAPPTERLPIIPWDEEPEEHDRDTPLMGVIRPRRR